MTGVTFGLGLEDIRVADVRGVLGGDVVQQPGIRGEYVVLFLAAVVVANTLVVVVE
ncbi:hypothetical protein D3C86_2210160 [compost metagenome]